MSRATVLKCPQYSPPALVDQNEGCYGEYLVISPEYFVCYNINQKDLTPNVNLSKYGGVLYNIPGDAIICKSDEDGETINIDDDILSKLSDLIKADTKQREKFMQQFM